MKQIDDQTFKELLEYLLRRPYFEVSKLINKLAQPAKAVEITTPESRPAADKE